MRNAGWMWSTDLGPLWNEIRGMIDGLTVPIAIVAVVVAMWSGIHARRAASAALASAQAAQAQASAANQQASAAQDQVSSAYQANRMLTLVSERDRVDRESADVVVLVDTLDLSARIEHDGVGRLPVPHPGGVTRQGPVRLSRMEHWSSDIYFLVSGTLVNDTDRCIRVQPHGTISFIDGTHPHTGEPVTVPPIAHPQWRTHVLFPGQAASFQWLPWKTLDDWIEAALRKDECTMEAGFVVMPGGYGTRQTTVRLELAGKLFAGIFDEDQDGWEIPASCHLELTTESTRRYIVSPDYIEADLGGDEATRSRLILRDMTFGGPHAVFK